MAIPHCDAFASTVDISRFGHRARGLNLPKCAECSRRRLEMIRASFRLTLAAIIVGAGSAPVMADQTGFASMHNQARVGGKMCFTDHFHYGSGNGSTRAKAEKDAIASWVSFTDFEYGSDWARYGKAVRKRMSCSSSGAGFSCQVEALPCR
jgi:hypothetical protein